MTISKSLSRSVCRVCALVAVVAVGSGCKLPSSWSIDGPTPKTYTDVPVEVSSGAGSTGQPVLTFASVMPEKNEWLWVSVYGTYDHRLPDQTYPVGTSKDQYHDYEVSHVRMDRDPDGVMGSKSGWVKLTTVDGKRAVQFDVVMGDSLVPSLNRHVTGTLFEP